MPQHDPAATHEDRVRPATAAVAAASDPIVVVGHSLAAAAAPLVALSRPGSLLVHLCPAPTGPFADSGAPMRAGRAGFPFPPVRAGLSAWEPQAAIDAMYRRLDPATARAYAERLVPSAAPAGEYPLTGHPDVPTVLIYAAEDEFFEPEWERWVAREQLGVEPIELAGGHFPMLEQPAALAALLSRLL